MTLQQLKYVITISKSGSMHTAADELFITQPNLSKAIKDLELEMGITIFNRTNKGVLLTDDGTKFLSYARQVVEQANLLEDIYKNKESIKRIFAISSQHYGFVVNAFVKLVETLGKDTYEFSLRECKTYDVINDVKDGRSELGVIYFSRFNSEIMKKVISSNGLSYEFLFEAKPHVLLSKNHPLANKERLTIQDITCDSDGKINNFISTRNFSYHLPVHELSNKEPYYFGVFLVGAYQEILGDLHNLFGDTNAVHIKVKNGEYVIDKIIEGETVADVLEYVQFTPKRMARTVEVWVTTSVKKGIISPEEGREFLSNYRSGLYGYTYLE